MVHPDGRLQRLRIAIAHPGDVRAGWSVVAEISRRVGLDLGVATSQMAFEQLESAVPFYAGLTLEEIGGKGIRWPDRAESAKTDSVGSADADAGGAGLAQGGASAGDGAADVDPAPRVPSIAGLMPTPAGERPEPSLAAPPPLAQPTGNGRGDSGSLRLGTHRSIWAWPEVEISPALKFLVPHQQVELAPPDARRLGIEHGEAVEVVQKGVRVAAVAHVRSDVPIGTAFLAEGISQDSANALTGSTIEVRRAAAPVGTR